MDQVRKSNAWSRYGRRNDTSEAEDFALVQLEGDVLYLGTVIEVFDLQQNIAVADILGREQVGHFAAYHHLDQLGTAEFTNRLGADILTITEDGNFICDGVYLISMCVMIIMVMFHA